MTHKTVVSFPAYSSTDRIPFLPSIQMGIFISGIGLLLASCHVPLNLISFAHILLASRARKPHISTRRDKLFRFLCCIVCT